MGTAVTPTAAGASPDAQQPAATAPQQPANGSEEPAPSGGRRQGSKRAAAVAAAAQISAQQQPRPPSRGSGTLAAVQTGAARQQQSNGDGSTPTTPRRMRALHEIPSLETQAHLGRRPSVPPDDEAALAAPDAEGQSVSVHRAMPRLPQVRPRSNGAVLQQAAEQHHQQQQQQQVAQHPRRQQQQQQQGDRAAAQAMPQHLNSRSSSPDDEPAAGDDGSMSGSERSAGSSREASPSELPEDPEAAARRRLQEDVVLMRATKIRAQRATKVLPPFPEPKRAKVHWDYLLEEMKWMSAEFARERKWKLGQAKRFGRLCARSNLDLESRAAAKAKQEAAAIRRRSAWIAKEVARFWDKAGRVLAYKRQTAVEAAKREALDRQLDFLVGQTQRYSSLLAKKLAAESERGRAAADAEGSKAAAAAQGDLPQLEGPGTSKPSSQPAAAQAAAPGDAVAAAAAATPPAAAQPAEAVDAAPASAVPLPAAGAASAGIGGADSGRKSAPGPPAGDDEADWAADASDAEEDDEATLDEEEAAARAAGDAADAGTVEAAGLADDADLPLEELLARYGMVVQQPGAAPAAAPHSPAAAGSSPDAPPPAKRRRLAAPAICDSSKQEPPPLQPAAPDPLAAAAPAPEPDSGDAAVPQSDLGALWNEADLDPETDEAAPTAAAAAAGAGAGDAEWAAVGADADEEDDEATLDEEAALDAAAGRDVKAEDAAEAAALAAEADMPLEELLAAMGYAPQGQPTAASSHADGGDAAQQAADGSSADGSAKSAGSARSKGAAAAGADQQADAPQQDVCQPSAAPVEAEPDEQWPQGSDSSGGGGVGDSPQGWAQLLAEADDAAQTPATPLNGKAKPAVKSPVSPAVPTSEKRLTRGAAAAAGAAASGSVASGAAAAEDSKRGAASAGAVKPEDQAAPAAEAGKAAEAAEAAAEEEDQQHGSLEDAARAAIAAQPTGFTLSTTNVQTKVPFLLKHGLREYQHIGLDWLVGLYSRGLNGILADEMGLGKTIMTIALLAYLAAEKGVWGPHLVVVPTSVMLNWEVEFKKWCPAFKLLTYYGSAKERKAKRQGWSKPNAFHIAITSYTLILQDAKMFRRKKWKYLILDEAHMIKNWRSQRWQTLLNFNSKRRLLITGTPLQNDLMELWSLMHFLMPALFASHADFKDWFSNPLNGMVEGEQAVNKALVDRLHNVLRPFLLRRLKRDVEKSLPPKFEHVVRCRLSRRQRRLYDEYMTSGETRSTLAGGNFMGIISCLMQLRKVCNHPDLFEGRPIVSSFDMWGLSLPVPSAATRVWEQPPLQSRDLSALGIRLPDREGCAAYEAQAVQELAAPRRLIEELPDLPPPDASPTLQDTLGFQPSPAALGVVAAARAARAVAAAAWRAERRATLAALSGLRTAAAAPLFGRDLVRAVAVEQPVRQAHVIVGKPGRHLDVPDALLDMVKTYARRAAEAAEPLKAFMCVIPKVRARPPALECSRPDASAVAAAVAAATAERAWAQRAAALRTAVVRQQLFFPDRRLMQYDCGKLQELDALLRRLKGAGSRALIFTQMTRMLDVLEAFLNLHGHSYCRLDGSTKPEQRQVLMQRFNTDAKLFVFILSTRSGGVGMNLTGADSVIFYDSDWNPAMDAQAQDRCHRIGQTRPVHIYRLVSEATIEENILAKSDQKRQLDHLAIQSGGFNTEFLSKISPRDLLAGAAGDAAAAPASADVSEGDLDAAMRGAEDDDDAAAADAQAAEAAAEAAEFNAEAAPSEKVEEDAEDAEDDAETAGGRATPASGPAAPAVAPNEGLDLAEAAEEDGLLADVVAMAGGAVGQDAIARLEDTLRPVDKYAVRFLEEAGPAFDVAAAAAAAAAGGDGRADWDVEQIQALQEQEDEAVDEDDELQVAEWDQAAADTAYREQVERAKAEEEAAEAEWAAAVAAQEAWEAAEAERRATIAAARAAAGLPPEEAPQGMDGMRTGPPRRRPKQKLSDAARRRQSAPAQPLFSSSGRPISAKRHWDDFALDTDEEDDFDWADEGGAHFQPYAKRRRSGAVSFRTSSGTLENGIDGSFGAGQRRQLGGRRAMEQAPQLPAPWEAAEDAVLAAVARDAAAEGRPAAAAWQTAADALAAGAAANSIASAKEAYRAAPAQRRTQEACQARFGQLLRALWDATAAPLPMPTAVLPAQQAVPAAAALPAMSPAVTLPVAADQVVSSTAAAATAAALAAAPVELSRPVQHAAAQLPPQLQPPSDVSAPQQQQQQQAASKEHDTALTSAPDAAPGLDKLASAPAPASAPAQAADFKPAAPAASTPAADAPPPAPATPPPTGAAAAALSHRIGALLRGGVGNSSGGATSGSMDPAVSAALNAALAAPPDPSEYGVPDRTHGTRAKTELEVLAAAAAAASAPAHQAPLQHNAGQAAAVAAAVAAGCGPVGRAALAHLPAVMGGLRSGGVEGAHAALLASLQGSAGRILPPRQQSPGQQPLQQPTPAVQQSQMRPQQQQQQQQHQQQRQQPQQQQQLGHGLPQLRPPQQQQQIPRPAGSALNGRTTSGAAARGAGSSAQARPHSPAAGRWQLPRGGQATPSGGAGGRVITYLPPGSSAGSPRGGGPGAQAGPWPQQPAPRPAASSLQPQHQRPPAARSPASPRASGAPTSPRASGAAPHRQQQPGSPRGRAPPPRPSAAASIAAAWLRGEDPAFAAAAAEEEAAEAARRQ